MGTQIFKEDNNPTAATLLKIHQDMWWSLLDWIWFGLWCFSELWAMWSEHTHITWSIVGGIIWNGMDPRANSCSINWLEFAHLLIGRHPSPSAPHNRHSSGQLRAEGSKPRAGGGRGEVYTWATLSCDDTLFQRKWLCQDTSAGRGGTCKLERGSALKDRGWRGRNCNYLGDLNLMGGVTTVLKIGNCIFLENLRIWGC